MIPLIRSFVHELLWSPERARVWLRAFLGWLFAAAAQVVGRSEAEIMAWTLKDWAVRLLIAGVLGFAFLLKAGDRNKPEGVDAVVHEGGGLVPADLSARMKEQPKAGGN